MNGFPVTSVSSTPIPSLSSIIVKTLDFDPKHRIHVCVFVCIHCARLYLAACVSLTHLTIKLNYNPLTETKTNAWQSQVSLFSSHQPPLSSINGYFCTLIYGITWIFHRILCFTLHTFFDSCLTVQISPNDRLKEEKKDSLKTEHPTKLEIQTIYRSCLVQ